MTVQEILDQVANMPTDADALNALADAIEEAYSGLVEAAGDNPTEEQVSQMEALQDAYAKVLEALDDLDDDADDDDADATEATVEGDESEDFTDRAKATADAFSRARDKRNARADEAATEGDDDGEFTADDDAGEPGADGDAAPGDADSDAGDDTDADDENEDYADNGDKEGKSMARTKFAGVAKSTAPAKGNTVSPFSVDVAAPNYDGAKRDTTLTDLAIAFEKIAGGRGTRPVSSTNDRAQVHFGHIRRDFDPDLVVTDEASSFTAIDKAVDESRLNGGSLVAAGGWCSPSETLYDFLPTTAATGLLSLPEVTVNRGGIRWPVQPDFSALYDATRFHMTEAEAIAGRTKECVEIPCVEMQEERLEVLWTCVTGNLLQNKGWPELTRTWIENAIKGQLYRLSAARLAKMRAESVKTAANIPTIGTAGSILNAVELHVEDLRLKYRLGNATMEGVAPSWLRTILRADLAYRDRVLPEQVTDAQLDNHFAARGVNFQYVDGYQDDIIGSGPDGLAYPKTVEVLLYPAGTFFSSVDNVVNLGVIYDSVGLSKNQRTEMFVEEAWMVGKRGYESRALTMPININGQTGLRVAPTAPGGNGGAEGN